MPDSPVPIIAALALHGGLAGLLVLIHAAWPLRVSSRKARDEQMFSGVRPIAAEKPTTALTISASSGRHAKACWR
jgi:hypothetical protein